MPAFTRFSPTTHTHTHSRTLSPVVVSSVREDRCTLPTTPSGTSCLLVGQRLSGLHVHIDGFTYALSLSLSLFLSLSRITEHAIVQRDTIPFLSHIPHHICFSPPFSVSLPLPVLLPFCFSLGVHGKCASRTLHTQIPSFSFVISETPSSIV